MSANKQQIKFIEECAVAKVTFVDLFNKCGWLEAKWLQEFQSGKDNSLAVTGAGTVEDYLKTLGVSYADFQGPMNQAVIPYKTFYDTTTALGGRERRLDIAQFPSI